MQILKTIGYLVNHKVLHILVFRNHGNNLIVGHKHKQIDLNFSVIIHKMVNEIIENIHFIPCVFSKLSLKLKIFKYF